jgi:ATP-dependent DNA ligase
VAESKCLNRQEFVVVGWTDPEGSRPYLGALLLGYYTDDGRLIYAGRVGTGMPDKVLADLRQRLEPLARARSPLSAPPPRKTRFGSPLEVSRVHWVEPQLVAEITYLTWTGDGLLRQTVYVGLRSDKPAEQVRREGARPSVSECSRISSGFDLLPVEYFNDDPSLPMHSTRTAPPEAREDYPRVRRRIDMGMAGPPRTASLACCSRTGRVRR